ncbi:MAG TPA: hydroxyacylglutathione hydrolase [Gammaproteobacteria bacterium]|nr:hydroxyacylglutathione hydrolase [Gammaproteobacteria bacterium]
MPVVHMFSCLSDNYGYLLHEPEHELTAAIDTPDAEVIARELEVTGWRLTHILNTHHHGDHAGGNLELKSRTGCQIIGPGGDAARIPGIDRGVGDGDTIEFGDSVIEVFETPGHTSGHIVFLLREARIAFVGDTLFSLGCGRLFEGTPAQMWNSLQKIMAWPQDTQLYCAHEYTLANGRFAKTVEPHNEALASRLAEVEALRARAQPSIPSTLATELQTNPFLRPDSAELRGVLGMPDASTVEVFARTRALKDAF